MRRSLFLVVAAASLVGCSAPAEPVKYTNFPSDCFRGAEQILSEIMDHAQELSVFNEGGVTSPWGDSALRRRARSMSRLDTTAVFGPEKRTVAVSYYMPKVSDQYPDPVAAAKENLDEKRRSSGLRRPLDLGQEGVSWNTPAIGIQEAGGAAAFRDANLVVHVSVEGTDYGPDRKSQPLDPAKAEQDAIRNLRAIKENL